MLVPRLPESRLKYGPRVYKTSEGERLNIAAVIKRYGKRRGIDSKYFTWRQREGWPSLGFKPLPSTPMQWRRGEEIFEELTYLDSEVRGGL
jgi:hypothetical protein